MKEKELYEPIEFEWDEYNSTKVRLRHGILPEIAEQVFLGKYLITPDSVHSLSEKRFHIIGATESADVLLISFTFREQKIRIISARKASRKERKIYEKNS
jgi:uncharacterized protein